MTCIAAIKYIIIIWNEKWLIDDNFFQMRNSSFNTKLVSGVEKRDPNKSIPGTWSKNTNQNIKESQGMHQVGYMFLSSIKTSIPYRVENQTVCIILFRSSLKIRLASRSCEKYYYPKCQLYARLLEFHQCSSRTKDFWNESSKGQLGYTFGENKSRNKGPRKGD